MALMKSGQMKHATPERKMPMMSAATKKLSPIALIVAPVTTKAGLDGPASRDHCLDEVDKLSAGD